MEASIDFGYELVKLGKINQAIDVYSLALKGFGNGKLPTGHYVLLQLRYAEALAMSGDLVKRYGGLRIERSLLTRNPTASRCTRMRQIRVNY